MELTSAQLEIINAESPKVLLELEGMEVAAIYSLGQMHHQVVRMTDNVFGNTRVGVFVIEEINGVSELDFSSPDPWRNIEVNSITLKLYSPNRFGGLNIAAFQRVFDIKSIQWLGL
jgi:hypothetical protein